MVADVVQLEGQLAVFFFETLNLDGGMCLESIVQLLKGSIVAHVEIAQNVLHSLVNFLLDRSQSVKLGGVEGTRVDNLVV